MPISKYYAHLRHKVGSDLLMMPAVAAVIHDKQGRLLLIRKREENNWGLPAGALEPGETPAEAVIRESGEETGLKVEPRRLLGVFGGGEFRHVYPNGDRVEYLVMLFACTVIDDEMEMDGEVSEWRWFSSADRPSLSLPYPPVLLEPKWEGPTYFQSVSENC